jgi:Tol biopolymer transport system component/DNA-binding winged helix-turn-helix (wHTH) protein
MLEVRPEVLLKNDELEGGHIIVASSSCPCMKGDFYLGDWLVHPSLGRMSLAGRVVQVRPKVMDLLVCLAGSPGTVMSKDTLLNEVWGTEAISESALTRTITELRNAVGDDVDQPRFLETIPKRGYRLVAPVRPVTISETARHSTWRRPVLTITIAAAVIAGLVAVVFFKMPPPVASGVRVKPLTTLPGQEGQASFSPDGKQVAFAWGGSTNDNYDIYVKGLADESLVQLTTDPDPDGSPAWSPDGRAIAFVRASHRTVSVYVVPAKGGAERPVATLQRNSAPVRMRILDWSADGGALVVVDQHAPSDPFHLARIALDTGERQQVTSPPPHSYGDLHPAVSPDGKTLAYTRALALGSTDIYFVSMTGGEPRRLTFDDSHISGLTWSEDGQSIIFSSERGALAGTGSLWRVRVGTSTLRNEPEQLPGIGHRATVPTVARKGRLLAYQEYFQDTNIWRASTTAREQPRALLSSTREETHPDYSPDGVRVAFQSNQSGNWEVWSANADGSHPRQVTTFAAVPAWNPRWSPDGRLLAFDHAAEGNADIYTIAPEGTFLQRLTRDPSQEITPSWARAGRWLYFSSNRSGAFEIWKMDLDRRERVVQITRGGGTNPLELPGANRVFYSKRVGAGLELWSTGVDGGDEIRVFGPIRNPSGWVPTPDGVYVIEPTWRIVFFRFARGAAEPVVTMPKGSDIEGAGLALSPDGRWLLYGQKDRSGADIMLVENFL